MPDVVDPNKHPSRRYRADGGPVYMPEEYEYPSILDRIIDATNSTEDYVVDTLLGEEEDSDFYGSALPMQVGGPVYMENGERPENLQQKLAFSIQQATVPAAEAQQYFDALSDEDADAIWGETQVFDDSPTGQPRILINRRKFEKAGAGEDYVREMEFGEGLHLLKYIAPDIFNDLYETAMSEQEPRRWLEEAYEKAVNEEDETRRFEDFVRYSRLDQVVGGYLSGDENSNTPTMRTGWNKELPFGERFRSKLEDLKAQLGITDTENPWFTTEKYRGLNRANGGPVSMQAGGSPLEKFWKLKQDAGGGSGGVSSGAGTVPPALGNVAGANPFLNTIPLNRDLESEWVLLQHRNASIKSAVDLILASNQTDAEKTQLIADIATSYGIGLDEFAVITGLDASVIFEAATTHGVAFPGMVPDFGSAETETAIQAWQAKTDDEKWAEWNKYLADYTPSDDENADIADAAEKAIEIFGGGGLNDEAKTAFLVAAAMAGFTTDEIATATGTTASSILDNLPDISPVDYAREAVTAVIEAFKRATGFCVVSLDGSISCNFTWGGAPPFGTGKQTAVPIWKIPGTNTTVGVDTGYDILNVILTAMTCKFTPTVGQAPCPTLADLPQIVYQRSNKNYPLWLYMRLP